MSIATKSASTPTTTSIACLESYLNPSLPISSLPTSDPSAPALHILPAPTISKLRNLGPARVKDMRVLGHSKQILSHIPIAASVGSCTRFNDALGAAIQMTADKFAALAMLPADGKDAGRELQRCVTKMRFVGGVLGLGQGNGMLDPAYKDLWTAAEKYRVPIVLRDTWPVGSELATYQTDLSDAVVAPLATHLHTAHNHSPLPILQLYLSNVFDRHSNVRLVLGHPHTLPGLLVRINTMLSQIPSADRPKRTFLDVWQNNFYVTTADVLDMSSMRTLLEQIPVDRVLYASNYPLEERGKELLVELKESGFLTKEDWERVAWGNAEFLFGLGKAGSAQKKT